MILLASSFLIVYLFPKGGTFSMNFKKVNRGNIKHFMLHLIFPLLRLIRSWKLKKGVIQNESKYYRANISVVNGVQNLYTIQFSNFLKIPVSSDNYNELFDMVNI